MAALHLIASSPDAGAALQNCVRAAAPDDTILLLGNGVYFVATASFGRIMKRSGVTRWHALAADVAQRGIRTDLGPVVVIGDADFVDLVTSHRPIVSWG
jgi:tRNA 2-thiouridine synthesizing protein B